MIKVGIIGASGYAGAELTRILCNHPQVELAMATSRQYEGIALSEVFPHLRGKVDLICENIKAEDLAKKADLFFTAVPHKTAMDLVPVLLDAGKKVIDLSADFRLRDLATYENWYQPHSSSQFLAEAVYGLPELYRQSIKNCRILANPGCYPTSIILGLAPLLKAGAIVPETIIADSKSGTSGAGRVAQTGTLFCEVHDGFRPYKVGRAHRHTPEIEQELSLLAKTDVFLTFTPHLLPISRGILSTIYATLTPGQKPESIRELFEAQYRDEPFIRLLKEDSFPATQYVKGSNFCDISCKIDQKTNRIIVMSAIDNVVKGAAGQAVQNMNIMCGIQEETGLLSAPLFP
ncbi:N-acetyl-gamma-glutamyl-phosphate reductase [Desulforhopalus sp. IMCC35007]|uniref:N-acetyl-gamma-glutamyl-phosphate reductase n=1 Tax=Desulforhopalus sp. IMCC35007 TaxID=2569543 RepID=UPI0010AECE7D|nr:N-acetyl-gamma-glutamyl-phosphate reductase [Desulforhopalus sp. IMCC35007]TKB08032.1 N-acetyl-gamma-glutamyl-phosphate reductase [Desulforhopalus sp. IMCC35007]